MEGGFGGSIHCYLLYAVKIISRCLTSLVWGIGNGLFFKKKFFFCLFFLPIPQKMINVSRRVYVCFVVGPNENHFPPWLWSWWLVLGSDLPQVKRFSVKTNASCGCASAEIHKSSTSRPPDHLFNWAQVLAVPPRWTDKYTGEELEDECALQHNDSAVLVLYKKSCLSWSPQTQCLGCCTSLAFWSVGQSCYRADLQVSELQPSYDLPMCVYFS